jgi:mycothiol synthase
MDPSRYSLRAFVEADIEEYTRLRNRMVPDAPIPSAMVRQEWNLLAAGNPPPFWRVVDEIATGSMVGCAGLLRNVRQDDPRRPWIFGEVDRAHRERGIGRELFGQVREEAVQRGAVALRAYCRADESGDFAFLEHRGFVERRRSWVSRLDPSAANLERGPEVEQRLRGEGFEFTTLAREGPDSEPIQRRVFDLVNAASEDVPRVGAYTPVSFEQFRSLDIEGELFFPESWMLAKFGDAYVGVSYAQHNPASPQTLDQALTATRREFRGRGIAEVLKVRLIEFARTNGFTSIVTANDSLNVPMWTLNQRLGFRKKQERIQAESPLSGAV